VSGITGIIDYDQHPQQEDVRMLEANIVHRGPDSKDFFAMNGACFAYRKWQFGAEQKAIIRKENWVFMLDAPPAIEDTIIDAWVREGMSGLKYINGFFAISIWNTKTEELFLLRSAEGARPLYWTRKNKKLAFCSEMSPILKLSWLNATLAGEHLSEYLSFRYVHSPRTLIENVYSVPAGHCVHLCKESTDIKKWAQYSWLNSETPIPRPEDVSAKLSTLFRKSVQSCLETKKPLGILLSGGIDSSLILHYACTLGNPIDTFTVHVEGIRSETSFAGRISKLMGCKNHEIFISKNEFIMGFESASRAMGQPLPSAAAVVQYLLFKKLRGMVLLSGEGGDDIFGGRSIPLLAGKIARAKMFNTLPYFIRKTLHRTVKRFGRSDLSARYEEYGLDRSIGSSSVFLAPERVDVLYDTGLVRPGIRKNVLTPIYQELDSDPINEILHVLQRGRLIEDALARNDRMSRQFGVDIRFPILDHQIIRYAAQLPGFAKVRRDGLDFIGKWPLRKMLANHIPKEFIHRPKRTMLDPLEHWLTTDGRSFLQRQIEGICDDLPHIFVRANIQQLYDQQRKGARNHSLKIWTLMHFYRWWRHTFH